MRYFEVNWPKHWSKPILAKVKKLWEEYRVTIPCFGVSYDIRSKEPKDLNTFDKIAQSLKQVT